MLPGMAKGWQIKGMIKYYVLSCLFYFAINNKLYK